MAARVLVTGAAGLIGASLVDVLLENGCNVLGYSTSCPLRDFGVSHYQNPGYHTVTGDICDELLMRQVFVDFAPTHVVHLAAKTIVTESGANPMETYRVNVMGTLSVLQAAMAVPQLKRIIVASSDKVYGESDRLPYSEGHPLNGLHPYDFSKRLAEISAHRYFCYEKLPVVVTRCANVFGPYELNFSRLVPGTIRSLLRGEEVLIRSNGMGTRSYVYSKDVARAYEAILFSPADLSGAAYNIGGSAPVRTLDLVDKIAGIVGGEPRIRISDTASGEISHQALDDSLFRKELQWQEGYSFAEAMRETVSWYQRLLDKW